MIFSNFPSIQFVIMRIYKRFQRLEKMYLDKMDEEFKKRPDYTNYNTFQLDSEKVKKEKSGWFK